MITKYERKKWKKKQLCSKVVNCHWNFEPSNLCEYVSEYVCVCVCFFFFCSCLMLVLVFYFRICMRSLVVIVVFFSSFLSTIISCVFLFDLQSDWAHYSNLNRLKQINIYTAKNKPNNFLILKQNKQTIFQFKTVWRRWRRRLWWWWLRWLVYDDRTKSMWKWSQKYDHFGCTVGSNT